MRVLHASKGMTAQMPRSRFSQRLTKKTRPMSSSSQNYSSRKNGHATYVSFLYGYRSLRFEGLPLDCKKNDQCFQKVPTFKVTDVFVPRRLHVRVCRNH